MQISIFPHSCSSAASTRADLQRAAEGNVTCTAHRHSARMCSCRGIAEVLRAGHQNEILLVGQDLPALTCHVSKLTQLNLSRISMLSMVSPERRRIYLPPPPRNNTTTPTITTAARGQAHGRCRFQVQALSPSPTPNKHTLKALRFKNRQVTAAA